MSVRRKFGSLSVARKAADLFRPAYRSLRPWAGLNGVDRLVLPYLPPDGGVFVEAGANDGIKQSNTLGLERTRGWRGILIEPVPRLAEKCRLHRPQSIVVNAALVDRASSGAAVELMDLDLMTLVVGGQDAEAVARQQDAATTTGVKAQSVHVFGKTLSEIIDESPFSGIDFLSLDVEGFEIQALSGIDFSRHSPKVMLVETSNVTAVDDLVTRWFTPGAPLSAYDYLYLRRDWATRFGG